MITVWMAVAVTIGAIYALIKRLETRLVLLAAGFLMAILSLDPMEAFRQFDKSMTNGGLIVSICSAMGFAAVVSLTKCDVHLVSLLTKPLKKMGVLLLPMCMIVTGCVAVAIPSTAGCMAAVSPTLVPLLVRSGFTPVMAAAGLVAAITPAVYNPGGAHNVFIAKIANMEVMDFIGMFSGTTLLATGVIIVLMTLVCVFLKEYSSKNAGTEHAVQSGAQGKKMPEIPANPNVLYAIAPLVPVALLIASAIWMPELKMSVATAMLIGAIYALAVTRTNPAEATKRFFEGMGRGYCNILGIIIAAGVFAAGLRAAGVIDLFVDYLTQANDVAKIGGTFGPYIMGVLTGSGDASTFAFNEAVTPYAEQFGMDPETLGYLAMMSGHFGRLSSPLAGGLILVAGVAGVNPLDIVKRTAPVMFLSLLLIFFVM